MRVIISTQGQCDVDVSLSILTILTLGFCRAHRRPRGHSGSMHGNDSTSLLVAVVVGALNQTRLG